MSRRPRTATREHPPRLFISAKTVDHHVSAVLAKFGTPNREVAASRAVALGLAGAVGP